MGWVKAGSVERDMLAAQRLEDFAINAMDRKSQKGVQSGPWDWAGKVNDNWKDGGRGLTGGFGQR